MKTIAYTAQIEGKLWYNRGTNKRTAKVLIHQRRSNDQEGISFMDATSDITTQLKQCTKCKEFFPPTTEYFPRQSRNESGLHAWCKPCNHRRDKEWKQNNPDKVLQNKKLYRERHPERVAEQKRQAEAKKPESYAEYRATWRKSNPDRVRKFKHATYQAHKHKWVRYGHEYRARKRGAIGSYSDSDIQLLMRSQRGKCWWCGIPVDKYHIDHRIPLSRGGSNAPENLCISCPNCNLRKFNKLPQEWNGRLL